MRYLTIGGAAKEAGYSREWLKILEARGVIRPERSSSGIRIYTEENLKQIASWRKSRGRLKT